MKNYASFAAQLMLQSYLSCNYVNILAEIPSLFVFLIYLIYTDDLA